MIHEPLKYTKDLPVKTDKVVDYVVDDFENPHTVSVGYAWREENRGYHKYRQVCAIDCFCVKPDRVRAISSLDDQIKYIISERLGENTEFDYDKIKMI